MLAKFEEFYAFSKDGNVYFRYSTGRYPKLLTTPKRMKNQVDPHGYLRYTLRDKNKKQYTVFQHKIVLIVNNVLPTSEQTQVNHKDGNILNNSLGNLEWCTQKENAKHRSGILQHRQMSIRKFTVPQVKTIRSLYVPFKKGSGILVLAAKYNCSYATMRDILQHKTYNKDKDYE